MFGYYLRLGTNSIRRHPALSFLMMLAVGLGIGVSMTLFSLHHTLSADPIPEKSDQLFAVTLDSWDPDNPYNEGNPEQPPWQLTYRDATALLESDVPTRHLAMHKSYFTLNVDEEDVKPFMVVSRQTTKEFFNMFNVPFLYGNGWDATAEESLDQVAVLSKKTNDKVFGGENSVGKTVRFNTHTFRVIGVLDTWEPHIKYYDVNNGPIAESEDVFVPFTLTEALELPFGGNNNCWKDEENIGHQGHLRSECIWVQFWAELTSRSQKNEYQNWIDNYVTEQKKLGRFERPLNNKLDDVNSWIRANEVVPDDLTIMVGIAFLFMAVCLFNAVGLLLARFMAKSPIVALRRAVGASKGAIFTQHLVEVGLIGIGGGLIGIVLAIIGLTGLSKMIEDISEVASFSWTLAGIAIGLSLGATLLAGLYPTWRICRVQPSSQLKTQ
ncbi:MAG: ABC transporter permease [Gammaproteobacteria bacterium]